MTTVAVNQFVFKQPVSIGDLLSFYATVERIGNTSITVRVEVYAERNPADVQVVKVTEANLTYVAIDREGKPRQIPTAERRSVDEEVGDERRRSGLDAVAIEVGDAVLGQHVFVDEEVAARSLARAA